MNCDLHRLVLVYAILGHSLYIQLGYFGLESTAGSLYTLVLAHVHGNSCPFYSYALVHLLECDMVTGRTAGDLFQLEFLNHATLLRNELVVSIQELRSGLLRRAWQWV